MPNYKLKKNNSILARLAGLAFIAISTLLIIVFIVSDPNNTLPGFPIPGGLNSVIRLIIALGSAGFFVTGLITLFTGDISYIKEHLNSMKRNGPK